MIGSKNKKRGFTIFFAALVGSLALAIGLAVYDLTARQLDLATTVSQSYYAIYAADAGIECALYWDSKYNGSSSVFPSSALSGSESAVFLTSGSSWTVPADWDNANNSIEVIGAGGGGGGGSNIAAQTHGAGGGGGGGYSVVENAVFTPGQEISYHVGTGGTGGTAGGGSTGENGTDGEATWFDGTSLGSARVSAAGGGGGAEAVLEGGAGGAGGNSSSGIGTTRYSGGAGGNSPNNNTNQGSGGGGAAGPYGNGVAGSGGTAAGGYGGAGDASQGGAGGGINVGGASGSEWNATHGAGGGGGGGQGAAGGAGGRYGGGGGGGGANGGSSQSWAGGNGYQGLIIIRYNRSVATPTDIICGSQNITSGWNVVTSPSAATTTFTLSFTNYPYCAQVEVAKVLKGDGTINTNIYSHGYNTCVANARGRLERELRARY